MDIVKKSVLSQEFDKDKNTLRGYLGSLDDDMKRVMLLSQSRIRFGDGTDGEIGENMAGQFQQFTSHATPDTEFAVTHTVGAIPRGVLIMWQDKAGSVYQGPTTGTNWTSTNVYLACDVASVTFNVFLLK